MQTGKDGCRRENRRHCAEKGQKLRRRCAERHNYAVAGRQSSVAIRAVRSWIENNVEFDAAELTRRDSTGLDQDRRAEFVADAGGLFGVGLAVRAGV